MQVEPDRRGPSGWRAVAVCVVAAVVVVGGSRLIDRLGDDDSASVVVAERVTIELDVTGTASWADVMIETPAESTEFSPDIPITNAETGERGITATVRSGDFVYLRAQNNTTLGDITCTIRTSNGAVISESTSSVDYGVVTCDGLAR